MMIIYNSQNWKKETRRESHTAEKTYKEFLYRDNKTTHIISQFFAPKLHLKNENMKKSIHRYPNEYLKNEYDIIYLSENSHTHEQSGRMMTTEWVGNPRDFSNVERDVTLKSC